MVADEISGSTINGSAESLAPADLSVTRLKPYPDADGGIAEIAAWSRRIAEAGARNGGPLIWAPTRSTPRPIARCWPGSCKPL
ncbi:hypothetical protein MTP10_30995 [Nonomuraea sp. 3-1Str]|uniref:hypothetical protein n=1 Tax=Nonomuraea sp. 3-1Str TaxID=2929801 RepID=UPI00285A11DE|nr:hypothetical protein [Nonomuraea sp. 3-1Str]MDR8413147.1 hypothetical protein [Nonomuraea sp. 3-1Str]